MGIMGVLLQYQRGEAADAVWKRVFIFRSSDRLVSESEYSVVATAPSSTTASFQFYQTPSIATPNVLHDLTNTDLRDTYDTAIRRPYPQGNDVEMTADDPEFPEVTALATSSDPRRWRIFRLLQTVILHGIMYVAGVGYTFAVARAVEFAVPEKILARDSIWLLIIFATLTGISAALIDIMKQRSPWQIISNFASTFAYITIILPVFKTIIDPSSIKRWQMGIPLPLVFLVIPLPLYLVFMVF